MLIVLIVVCFSYIAIRIARFLFSEIERETISWPGFYPEWAMPTYKIVELLIVAFALVIMFPYLPGSDSPAFKGITIFFGVLFSLGSSSAVANVIAGVILTYTRAFRVGDRVQIADTVGDIVSKSLLATQMRTIKNVQITIPNSLVLGNHIINFSSSAVGQAADSTHERNDRLRRPLAASARITDQGGGEHGRYSRGPEAVRIANQPG